MLLIAPWWLAATGLLVWCITLGDPTDLVIGAGTWLYVTVSAVRIWRMERQP